MVLFQILFLVFSLLAIVAIIRHKKESGLSSRGLFLWVIFWIMADVVVIWPGITNIFASKLGIGRGSDLVLYISIVLIFYILFKLHVKLESINRDITKIVRERSLEQSQDEK